MNITDLRKVAYKFGSPEWLEYLKKNHIIYPLADRRKATQPEDIQQETSESGLCEKKYVRIFLSPEEKKLIQDVYLSDLE